MSTEVFSARSTAQSPAPRITVSRPRLVVETDFAVTALMGWRSYDISLDGERFLMARPLQQAEEEPRLVYVPDWADELERLFEGPDR